MNHSTFYKFCRLPITVTVDDDYAQLGDPYKLLQKACCNRCSDVRELRRLLEHRISRVATTYAALHRPGEATKDHARQSLSRLCQSYARMIARWHNVQGMAWDDAAVETVLESPNQWPEVLTNLWRMFRQWQREQPSVTREV